MLVGSLKIRSCADERKSGYLTSLRYFATESGFPSRNTDIEVDLCFCDNISQGSLSGHIASAAVGVTLRPTIGIRAVIQIGSGVASDLRWCSVIS